MWQDQEDSVNLRDAGKKAGEEKRRPSLKGNANTLKALVSFTKIFSCSTKFKFLHQTAWILITTPFKADLAVDILTSIAGHRTLGNFLITNDIWGLWNTQRQTLAQPEFKQHLLATLKQILAIVVFQHHLEHIWYCSWVWCVELSYSRFTPPNIALFALYYHRNQSSPK